MTETLTIWLIIAKSPKPISADEIRAQHRCKELAQIIGRMARIGQLRKRNIDGVAHYTAIESPARLTMQHIADIAKVHHEQQANI